MAKQIKRVDENIRKFIEDGINKRKQFEVNYICSSYCRVPTFGWDKPFYAVMDGRMREVLIEGIDFITPPISSSSFNDSIYHLNVAGIGKVECRNWWNSITFDAYLTEDDVNNERPIVFEKNSVKTNFLDMLNYACGDCGDEYYTIDLNDYANDMPYRYRWNENECKAYRVNFKVPMAISYSNDEFYFRAPLKCEEGTYASKEECVKANKLEIVRFGDMPTDENNKKKIVSFFGCAFYTDEEDLIKTMIDSGLIDPIS